jgi:hypothetical protein
MTYRLGLATVLRHVQNRSLARKPCAEYLKLGQRVILAAVVHKDKVNVLVTVQEFLEGGGIEPLGFVVAGHNDRHVAIGFDGDPTATVGAAFTMRESGISFLSHSIIFLLPEQFTPAFAGLSLVTRNLSIFSTWKCATS